MKRVRFALPAAELTISHVLPIAPLKERELHLQVCSAPTPRGCRVLRLVAALDDIQLVDDQTVCVVTSYDGERVYDGGVSRCGSIGPKGGGLELKTAQHIQANVRFRDLLTIGAEDAETLKRVAFDLLNATTFFQCEADR